MICVIELGIRWVVCFRATAGGPVSVADDNGEVPFAVMIRFVTDFTHRVRAEVDVPA